MKGELLADDVTEPDDPRSRAEQRQYGEAKASAERKDSFFFVFRSVANDMALLAVPGFVLVGLGLGVAAVASWVVWVLAVFIGAVIKMLNEQQERVAYLGALVESELHTRDLARKNAEKRRA